MIEEVVNSILQAEDVAKERVEAAEQRAAEIVSAAEQKAEQIRKQASLDNKEFLSKSLSDADADAEREAKDLLEKLNSKTDEEKQNLEKRVQDAVKIILESI